MQQLGQLRLFWPLVAAAGTFLLTWGRFLQQALKNKNRLQLFLQLFQEQLLPKASDAQAHI